MPVLLMELSPIKSAVSLDNVARFLQRTSALFVSSTKDSVYERWSECHEFIGIEYSKPIRQFVCVVLVERKRRVLWSLVL
jgi:hypothetical protein